MLINRPARLAAVGTTGGRADEEPDDLVVTQDAPQKGCTPYSRTGRSSVLPRTFGAWALDPCALGPPISVFLLMMLHVRCISEMCSEYCGRSYDPILIGAESNQ